MRLPLPPPPNWSHLPSRTVSVLPIRVQGGEAFHGEPRPELAPNPRVTDPYGLSQNLNHTSVESVQQGLSVCTFTSSISVDFCQRSPPNLSCCCTKEQVLSHCKGVPGRTAMVHTHSWLPTAVSLIQADQQKALQSLWTLKP